MKIKKSLIGLCLAVLSLTGVVAHVNNEPNKAEAAVGSYTTDSTSYYSSINFSKSGKALLGPIHDLITSTHKTYTTYDDNGANGYQKKTDQYYSGSSAVSGYIYEFYSGVKWPATWAATAGSTTGGYNREHLWCQSLSSSLWGEKGGGADMHHIRPTEVRLNSIRSNNVYGTLSSRTSYKVYAKYGTDTTYALAGYNNSGVFEPLDSKKGDVARIIFYVYTHYNKYSNSIFGDYASTNGSGTSSYFGSLSLTQITNKSTEAAAASMLLSWHESDPVDAIETRRNEQVAKYQGNRNPFIDIPNLPNRIWGDASKTITGLGTGGSSSGGTSGDSTGGSTTVEEPSIKSVSSLSAILNDTASDLGQKYSIKGLEVTSWASGQTDGTQYGNFYVSDGTTNAYVYGASASSSIISWSGSAYTYNTQTDFLTNATTSAIALGDTIDCQVIRSTYNSAAQLHAYITKVTAGDGSSSGGSSGGSTTPSVPEGTGTTGTMVINESYAYTRADYLTSGKYIFATRTDSGYYILDPALVKSTSTYKGVFTTSLTNYASYYMTVTVSGSSATIYANGKGSASHTSYYLAGNSSSSLKYSTSAYYWGISQSYYAFGTYNGACVQFVDSANTRNLHFRAGSYNTYGCYAQSNYNGAEYACPYLYEVDTAYNYLIDKLYYMSCSDMTSSTFYSRITYLFSLLSTSEVTSLKSTNIVGYDGNTYTAYEAYYYAINYYSNSSSLNTKLFDDLSRDNSIILIGAVSALLSVALISVVVKKARKQEN